ncbi:MAG TPA: phosphatase PAP2 family protein [Candidatus Thalassarchaeaceae archaeon]|nr:phosphatase PAP2 family protein [Candidatus Thalassarchaeaceae archaeon]
MVAETGIYITWVTGAILVSIAMMPFFKPPYAKISADGFIDMFRRYWAHMVVVFSVYLWKDLLDGLDRVLMANTQLDMTFLVYAIEGDTVLWVQEGLRSEFLDVFMTHFYVMGFMTATFASFVYPIYFDDRHMADRVSLSMFWVYILAIPFYLFLNVKVTGNYVEGMETIAYDLTPEIHNWFNRIDPFTNGMPSLHIGLPFAIWLSMHRWDEDGRWERFRIFLIIFIALTSVSIVYLGIHWFVDIIGGMVIAILAVNITAKTHEPIWRIADERLFTRRLARTLEDPSGSIKRTFHSFLHVVDPVKEPGKNQTGALILALIVLTGSVLLWDVTHQKISIDEANSPTSASGSGEWLVWVEESERGVTITAGNVTSETNRTVGGQPWVDAPRVVSSGTSFVVFDNHRTDYFEHNQESGVLQPLFWETSDETIVDIAIPTDSIGGAHLAVLSHQSLRLIDTLDQSSMIVELHTNSSVLASSGSLVAISETSEAGPLVNITSIDSELTISILLDPRSSERIENSIQNSGTILDFSNSTIVELVMDSNWLVATVDVGPFNRTILVDMLSINQTLISNPRWDSSSPSIGDGRVAFLQVTRDDILSLASTSERNNDVYVHELLSGETKQYTFDEDVDQSQPQILLERLAWIEVNDDGEKELQLYSFTDTIEPRNSLLLQASILAMIPLIFLWTLQSYGIEKIIQQV